MLTSILLQIAVGRYGGDGRIGETKTAASSKPVPLHPGVAEALKEWRRVTEFKAATDFLFPSVRNNGRVPVWPDTLAEEGDPSRCEACRNHGEDCWLAHVPPFAGNQFEVSWCRYKSRSGASPPCQRENYP